ncbi:MAG: hypothetical protein MR787_04485 [Bacteroidales bacterium]|nr:hypothetical protein [Bacteroidales bacterium]
MINVINRTLGAKKKVVSIFSILLMFTATSHAEVVWNGNAHNVGSWNSKRFAVSEYTVLSTASEGDVIALTITAVDNTNDKKGRITLQSYHYQTMGSYDEHNVTATGVFYFTLTKQAVDSLKTTGFNVTGENFTFNKVELLYKKALWTGALGGNADWIQSNPLEKQIFSDLKEGDIISIECKNLTDTLSNKWGHACVLRYNYADNIIDKWTNVAGTYHKVLTLDDVTKLKEEGKDIILVARWLVITSLNTYLEAKPNPGPATAIDNTNANANAVKSLRNGRLIILRDNKTYNVMGQVE